MSTRSVPATLFTELKTNIKTRQASVAIIGLSYVGLPLALLGGGVDRKYEPDEFSSDPVNNPLSEKTESSRRPVSSTAVAESCSLNLKVILHEGLSQFTSPPRRDSGYVIRSGK
jgi:hypothetical protein